MANVHSFHDVLAALGDCHKTDNAPAIGTRSERWGARIQENTMFKNLVGAIAAAVRRRERRRRGRRQHLGRRRDLPGAGLRQVGRGL